MNNETKQNLKIDIQNLENLFIQKKKELVINYLSKNNPYKVGDIFTDHLGSIKIERIGFFFHLSKVELSCSTYSGKVINKDGTFNKKGLKRTAYQSNELK